MRAAALLLTFVLAGCGYFNTMYNAQRRFADAERAAARGDRAAAESAWRDALDKAAASVRKDPAGRWADDALLIVGRAHFGLGRYDAAAAALERAVATTDDRMLRGRARLWRGAALLELGEPRLARAELDTALADLDGGVDGARARLWRGRASLALGRPADAWADLEAAAAAGGGIAATAYLEMAGAAIAADDSTRHAAAAAAALAHDAHAADSVASLSRAAAQRWGPGFARSVLDRVDPNRLTADARDRILLERARHAAAAGDMQAALDGARAAAGGRGPVADMARVSIARWLLAEAPDAGALGEADHVLLPSVGNADARALHDAIASVIHLMEQGESGEELLALYAAAELARDELGAPALARALFLDYAHLAAESVWAPKAALAAAALGAPANEVELRLHAARPDNPYISLLHGRSEADAFADAEAGLSRELHALRAGARTASVGGDPSVASAAAAIDSVRAAMRTDSLHGACSAMMDSLKVTGIRADSVRSACVRGDTGRAVRMAADTTRSGTP